MHVFLLTAVCPLEEEILKRAKQKMVLDHLVIQRMDTSGLDTFAAGQVVRWVTRSFAFRPLSLWTEEEEGSFPFRRQGPINTRAHL